MKWTVSRLIEATGGELLGGDPALSVRGISTDTRRLEPRAAFVALCGEQFDGHRFVAEAVAKGAVVLIVSRPEACANVSGAVAVIVVQDTLVALGRLARYLRERRDIPVIGVTGSNGKTSTKELLATILGANQKVLKNQGNFNNLVGVPLTLLQLDETHQAAVIEMGINVPGEMERLVAIAVPTIGLITNIHPAHLEGLGSLDAILREKGLLWRGLPADGVAVVNLDDRRLARLAQDLRRPRVSYSLIRRQADVHLRGGIRSTAEGCRFTMVVGGGEHEVNLPVLGRHQVQNALAAAAAARAVGLSGQAIAQALGSHQQVRQRMEVIRLADGTLLVDDTYNANPRSVEAALDALCEADPERPRIAVVADMRELGGDSELLHRRLGQTLAGKELDLLITYGRQAEAIREGALAAGMELERLFHAASHEAVIALLEDHWIPGAWVLVKGSRGMTMEKVTNVVVKERNG